MTQTMLDRHYHDRRRSRDDVWPLRCADGRTFAERKRAAEGNTNDRAS